MKKVLIINSGGTIGMVGSPLRPCKDWNEIIKFHPILDSFNTDYIQIDPLIDSSDVTPELWKRITETIEYNYSKYAGFVVLHGTDTMAFTASALSFMLKNLLKPVILTGSQVPLQSPRSDALQNLITAIQIAGHTNYNVPLVPEVAILFRDILIRGNRSKKVDATNYFGFISPNYPDLGEIGAEIKILDKNIIKRDKNAPFYIENSMNEDVMILELFPGLKIDYIKNIFEYNKNIKGLILKTYGNGNTPTNKGFLNLLKDLIEKEILIVNITQCVRGAVKQGIYVASSELAQIGVISGNDLTIEAGITKLMYLLSKNFTYNSLKMKFQEDICGEQSTIL